jgi:hypothetical protein
MEINGKKTTVMQQIQAQTHLPATSQPKNLNVGQRRALAMFRNRNTLLQRYNQDMAPVMDEYDAIMGESPTLAVMNSTFGAGTAEVIIASKLSRLNQYTNVKMKITPEQADTMATSIVSDPDLKGVKGDVLALFFERLKTGKYGELYNIVDAVSITAKLRQFYRECEGKRIAWTDHMEREAEENKRKQWAETALKPHEIEQLRLRLQQEGKI